MKNLRIVAAVFAILLISAVSSAQIWESVRGNHNVVKKERKLQSFKGVKVSSGIDVYLSQGSDEKVVVEADENLHEYITTEIRNGVLNVYTEVSIRDAERKRVYVTMKEVNSIQTTSAGDVVGQTPVKTERLDLSASSAGNIDLEVNADELNVNISSSGDVSLKGATRILDADLSSAGDLNAYDLESREADIRVSSAGDAEVNVLDKITARASSAGDITYAGNPKYVDAHSSSAGGIHRR